MDIKHATPVAHLLGNLMNPSYPKNEMEHAAADEIQALRAQVASLQSVVARKDEALLEIGKWIENLPVPTNGAMPMLFKIDSSVALKASDVKAPATQSDIAELTSLKVIAEIREIIGVGNKPMMTELPDILRKALAAYEQGKV